MLNILAPAPGVSYGFIPILNPAVGIYGLDRSESGAWIKNFGSAGDLEAQMRRI